MWMWIVAGLLAALALFVGVVAWGLVRLRRGARMAQDAIARVTLADIDRLRVECEAGFRRAFATTLSLEDFAASAAALGERLDDARAIKDAFARDDFYWYFVLPTGAYLGELLRVHAGGAWEASAGGGVELTMRAGGGEARTFPFDKVLKHCTMGAAGDIQAYLYAALRVEDMVAGLQADPRGAVAS